MVGISKQGHYKRVNHLQKMEDLSVSIVSKAQELRLEHGRIGCRKMFYEIQPKGLGRDKTEALLLSNGFRVTRKRNYHRTTYAGKHWYPNLISGLEVRATNQLWVSDITYIAVSYKKYFYLTLVLDVYSRKITGWQLSDTMRADDTVLPAYDQAITAIDENQRKGLIFHSDKGSQYSWKELEDLHIQNGVNPSMGGKAWENAHAESLNGILKNEYIEFDNTDITLKQGRKLMRVIIQKYNNKRPHGSLKNMKPVEFETYVHQLTSGQRPVFKINY